MFRPAQIRGRDRFKDLGLFKACFEAGTVNTDFIVNPSDVPYGYTWFGCAVVRVFLHAWNDKLAPRYNSKLAV